MSEPANKWAQQSVQAKQVVQSKRTSKWCEQTSERTNEWPRTFVWIFGWSGPQCSELPAPILCCKLISLCHIMPPIQQSNFCCQLKSLPFFSKCPIITNGDILKCVLASLKEGVSVRPSVTHELKFWEMGFLDQIWISNCIIKMIKRQVHYRRLLILNCEGGKSMPDIAVTIIMPQFQ